MSFWDWFARMAGGHLHSWETVDTLRDRPKNPTAATVIQCCRECGEVRQLTFAAPKGTVPPPVCPPHKWQFIGQQKVYRSNDPPQPGELPLYHIERMQCSRCGERKDHKCGGGA